MGPCRSQEPEGVRLRDSCDCETRGEIPADIA
jgi:hypothetical protein